MVRKIAEIGAKPTDPVSQRHFGSPGEEFLGGAKVGLPLHRVICATRFKDDVGVRLGQLDGQTCQRTNGDLFIPAQVNRSETSAMTHEGDEPSTISST